MKLNDFNKEIWLWLRERGGHWTSQDVAQHTGKDPMRTYRALHNMTRLDLVEIVPPVVGALRKRYGVTDACWAPARLTVGEVSTGKPAKRQADLIDFSRAAVVRTRTKDTGLSPAERPYLRNDTRFESGLA